MPQSVNGLGAALALAAYFLLVWSALAWQQSHGTALAVWPAGGVLLGYALIRPQYPPVQLLGAALMLDLIARLLAGDALVRALSFGLVDMVEIACAIFVARRQSAGLGARLQRTSELAHRLLPACFAASLLATLLKTLTEVGFLVHRSAQCRLFWRMARTCGQPDLSGLPRQQC